MRNILPGILSLVQHNHLLETNIEQFRPKQCPYCSKSGLWFHGSYSRKADYEHAYPDSLNPITILRFYCPCCHATCSVLPECIPPRRHYLWKLQEVVLLLLMNGLSYRKVSQQVLPSRWTISRWVRRLKARQLIYASHLRSFMPSLGRLTEFIDFWQALLKTHSLSYVMLNLNNARLDVP